MSNFQCHVRNGSSNPLHVSFYGKGFRGRRIEWRCFQLYQPKMAANATFDACTLCIYENLQRIARFSCDSTTFLYSPGVSSISVCRRLPGHSADDSTNSQQQVVEFQSSCNHRINSMLVTRLVVSVAQLVARRTNNRKVVGSIPANAVCFTVDR